MAIDGADSTSFWGAAVAILLSTLGVLVQQFLKGRKEEARPSHYVIEQAEIADVGAIRDLAKQFGPALEKLTALDAHNREAAVRFEQHLRDILKKLEMAENDARTAKVVRDELAREREQERRDSRHRDRSHDTD